MIVAGFPGCDSLGEDGADHPTDGTDAKHEPNGGRPQVQGPPHEHDQHGQDERAEQVGGRRRGRDGANAGLSPAWAVSSEGEPTEEAGMSQRDWERAIRVATRQLEVQLSAWR